MADPAPVEAAGVVGIGAGALDRRSTRRFCAEWQGELELALIDSRATTPGGALGAHRRRAALYDVDDHLLRLILFLLAAHLPMMLAQRHLAVAERQRGVDNRCWLLATRGSTEPSRVFLVLTYSLQA